MLARGGIVILSVTLIGCSGNEPPDQPASTPVGIRESAEPLTGKPTGDSKDLVSSHHWTVEYTWFHDVPRGGTHRIRLDGTGTLTEEWQGHSVGEAVKSSRNVVGHDLQNAFDIAASVVDAFTFESTGRPRSHDVPAVTFSLERGGQEVQIQLDDWFAAPRDLSDRVIRFLQLLHVRPR
jgi:hypothetical protein